MINLKDARINAGMTQFELANKCKIARSVIANIETGRAEPSKQTAIAISKALNLDPRELFDWGD